MRLALPRADELLLLHAALDEGAGAAPAAWQRWLEATGGVAALDETSSRIAPLVYRRLSEDDPAFDRLRGVYRHTWLANNRLLHMAASVLEDLAAAGIPTLLRGGVPLLALYYRTAGERPLTGFDIVVPPEARAAAFELLLAQGWRDAMPGERSRGRVTRRSMPFTRDGHELDLHWTDWSAAVPLAIHGASTVALGPTDELLWILERDTRRNSSPYAWIADAVTLLRAAGPHLDRDRLRGRRVAAALAYVTREFQSSSPSM